MCVCVCEKKGFGREVRVCDGKIVSGGHVTSRRGEGTGWCLGDAMCTPIGLADLGGWILKWPRTDEKLCSVGTEGGDLPRQGRNFLHFGREIINFRGFGGQKWISHF